MIYSIKLDHVRKTYRPSGFKLAIDCLEFTNRTINVIVGPNGSGKTSLFRLIALLDRPQEGSILFNDIDTAHGLGGLRKKIGFIMQRPYLFDMSVFDNVALGLRIRHYPPHEIESRVNNLLAALKIEKRARQGITYLSGGEHQKVAIAQVLVFEPEIVLIDEPAANIDLQSTVSIEAMVRDIYTKYKPVIIMSTHSLAQAYRMAPEVISLNEGRVADIVHRDIFSFNSLER